MAAEALIQWISKLAPDYMYDSLLQFNSFELLEPKSLSSYIISQHLPHTLLALCWLSCKHFLFRTIHTPIPNYLIDPKARLFKPPRTATAGDTAESQYESEHIPWQTP
jgi:hypothetical protein